MAEDASSSPHVRSRSPPAKADEAANAVDAHVGAAISARRRKLGVTQISLAQAVGVTYQQVQKYESGRNRISASRLWDVSVALKCDIADLFGGVSQATFEDGPAVPALAAFLKAVYGQEAAARFEALPTSLQLQIISLLAPLARTLAGGAP